MESVLLSVGEQALWALRQSDPLANAYNVGIAVRVRGGLDPARLRTAVAELARAHPPLRTTVEEVDGKPYRVVREGAQPSVEIEETGEAARAEYWCKLPFSFTDPPFRCVLLRDGERGDVLVVAGHHIFTDFRSQGLIVQALLNRYSGLDTPSAPDPVRTEPGDMSEYWAAACAGADQVLRLPLDQPRPPRRSGRGRTHVVHLAPETADRAKRLKVSFFAVLLTAFQAVLHRYTGQTDFLVASPVDLRRRLAGEDAIGYFTNLVALRARIDERESFHHHLARVQERVTGALRHASYPFASVAADLVEQRDPSLSPLCQVAFGHQDARHAGPLLDMVAAGERLAEPVELAGLLLYPFDLPQQEGQFDLAVEATETTRGTVLTFRYDDALFLPSTIERFARHFRTFLADALERPAVDLAAVDMLDGAELDLIRGFGRGAQVEPAAQNVVDLIDEAIRRTPDAEAVTALSYAELDLAADRLSALIRQAPAVGDGPVAVLVPSGREAAVAALGVWRAGCAFVPLDPAYPAERLDFMLRDSGATVLITSRDQEPRSGLPVVFVEDIAEAEPATDRSPLKPDDVAYVIYTSGSTGTPKGVEVTHRGFAVLATWQRDYFGIGPHDRVLQFASPSFDAFLWELAMALCNGAMLCCPAPGGVLAGPDLAAALAAAQPTVVTLPPSVLLTISPAARPASLRTVVVAGEACPTGLVAEWQPHVRLVNAYGPTETTVCATAHTFDSPDGPVLIGTPIHNAELHVVDAAGRPSPIGVPGQLLVGGPGVAKGYLGRPELTAERFSDGLYRTGDVVRWDESGALRYDGRDDRQVKLHGHRIEPAEVEHVLTSHPRVRQAAVTVAAGFLTAYVVGDLQLSTAELLAHARSLLPRYLCPQKVVAVGEIPLTQNGKTDWAALPSPGGSGSAAHTDALSALEATISAIWAELLGCPAPGPDADFFALGGHSLLAAQVAALVRQRAQRHVTVAGVMEHPVLADLARNLEELPDDATPSADEVFPLTETQRAYWLGRRAEFELGGTTPHGYFELAVPHLDVPRLEAAWNLVVGRHEMLRAVVTEDGDQRVLRDTPHFRVTAHRRTGEQREELRERMVAASFDPTRWPSFDLQVSNGDDGDDLVHLAMDAVFVDGSSLRIILRDLAAAYHSGSVAPPPRTRFCTVAQSAARVETTASFARAKQYWLARAASLPPAPDLPATAAPGGAFATLSRRVPTATWQAVRDNARKRSLTPTAVLLTAYAEVLAAWSRSRHFTVNVTLAERQPGYPDIDEVVGDFTNLLLAEVDLSARPAFASAAAETQQRLISDLGHSAYSGLRVLRERARLQGGNLPQLMPIVFTGMLGDPGSFAALGRLVHVTTRTPQVWLDHVTFEDGDELAVIWNHLEGVLPEGVAADMFASYLAVLDHLATPEAWEAPVHPGLPAAQRRVRRRANETRAVLPAGGLHEPFFQHARRTPERPAVITPSGTLTYGELARRALAVCAALRTRGAGAGELVAVAASKGWQQVAGVLGVLAAGAAYLPVNLDLPVQRRRELLAIGHVRHLLTSASDTGNLDPGWPGETLVVDELPDGQDQAASVDMNLAYVIFTSGSTGVPKGVMIDHRAARNTVEDINRRFAVHADDRVLGVSDLSFDLSVYDIFGSLSAGAALVLPDPQRALEPDHWLDLMAGHGVTLWNSVPVLMRLLAERLRATGRRDAVAALRLALLSGDWIPLALPAELAAWSTAKLVSLGGATEAAVWSIAHDIGAARPGWTSVPYGKPLANQAFHVLDDELHDRPDWVAGELYIGGAGLARGYLDDSRKTGQRFIHHPRTGERLYRTGDLGRYREDGIIEFLGREDGQVKINGHRLELGEIETALRDCDGVKEAVVTAPLDAGGGRTLHGYVLMEPSGGEVVSSARIPDALWTRVVGDARETTARDRHRDGLARMARFEHQVEQLATAVIRDLLHARNLFTSAGEQHSPEELCDLLDVARPHRPLVTRWLEALAADGDLDGDGESYVSRAPLEAPDLPAAWARLDEAADWGETGKQLVGYLRACANRLPEVLSGALDPAELLFPGGTLDVADALYRGNPLLDLCNELVAQTVAAVAGLGRARILELGAGTGGTTSAVLPVLTLADCEYRFTDISEFLLDQSRRRLGSYPFVRFQRLDIDRLAYEPGIQAAQFDVVIAANVLHDAQDAGRTLTHIREALAPGGALIMVEGTGHNRMQLFSLALLEGLNNAGDALTGASTWLDRLGEAGFHRSEALLGPADQPLSALAQTVIVAQADVERRVLDLRRLRDDLTERLPSYAVPAHLSQLTELPLTANGKIDRAVLERTPADQRRPPARRADGPLTPATEAILEVWREILEDPEISAHDSLFESGGDSLTAIKLSAALRDRLGVDVRVRTLLSAATPAATAEMIEKRGDQVQRPQEVAAPRAPSRRAKSLPLVVQRDYTSYLYGALPLCVALAHGGREWFYERYVELYSTSHVDGRRAPTLDFRDAFAFSEVLHTEPVTRAGYARIDDPVDFVRGLVDTDRYVIMFTDDHQLRGLPTHFVHEFLIYGYDDAASTIHAVGFDDDHLFTALEFSYDLFERAFLSAREQMDQPGPFALIERPALILTPRAHPAAFDPRRLRDRVARHFEPAAHGLVDLDLTGWWWWTTPHLDTSTFRVRTGLGVYDHLLDHLRRLREAGDVENLDYRVFHLLAEHKKIVRRRLDYVGAGDLSDRYQGVVGEAEAIRRQVLQHLRVPQWEALGEVEAGLVRMNDTESVVLAEFLSLLEGR